MKQYEGDSTKDYGQIEISCICGKKYITDRRPLAECPHCGHVWNLHPAEQSKENIFTGKVQLFT